MPESLSYEDLSMKYRFLMINFRHYLKGKILDIGCGEGKKIKGFCDEYVGVDIQGDPDIKIDLEKEKLPFKKGEFDCIVCSHVIEHLDEVHDFLGSLSGFTKKYMIICLPNQQSLSERFRMLMGKSNNHLYGYFPAERHKWFANYRQSKRFVEWLAEETGMRIVEERMQTSERGSFLPDFIVGKFPNLFANYWAVLEKMEK